MASEHEYGQPTSHVDASGNTKWQLPSGELHRLDGPAVIGATGTKYWWVNGKLHRLDGPAIDYSDGPKRWYIDGQVHTEQQWTLEVCRRLRDGERS